MGSIFILERRRWPRRAVTLPAWILLSSACATFQQPKPVGEPSPLACYGAKRTREAWEQVVREYVNRMMEAQEAYSCQQPDPPPEPPPQSLTPADCAR